MANPMFTPETSTNQIYRDQDDTRCLTDDLDAIEADIDALQAGKANTSHTHSGYATADHTHSGYATVVHAHSEYANANHTHDYAASVHTHEQAEVEGLATALAGKASATHTHDYAPSNHTHTANDVGAASASHTHAQSEVSGLTTALAGKAAASHTHVQNEVTGLATTLAAKADLVDGKVPESQLPSYVSDIVECASFSAFPATGEANKIYVDKSNNKTYRWGGTGYVLLDESIALGETSATAYRGDRGKVAYEHSQNATVHVTAAQKTAWDAKQNALTFDTTPKAGSTNPVTSGGIKSALDGKANSSHTHNYAAASHTHEQTEISGLATALAGKASTTHSHNYAAPEHTHNQDDVTGLETALSNIEAMFNGYATTDHTHTAEAVGAIAKTLQMVADTGDVKHSLTGVDVLENFAGLAAGMHTAYCPVNSTNAPNSNEAWRFLIHKTSTVYGWVLAFGSYGSVYGNYLNNGTWRGWKNLIDGTSNPLWKHESNGGYYMTASQTVTPSKPLNQCRNGWVLMWSDYDADTGVTNNADICTTIIPKRNPTGALWGGQGFLCLVPGYVNETEVANNTYVKKVYVHNDKLVGFAGNNVGNRRDVVLRAVYEY